MILLVLFQSIRYFCLQVFFATQYPPTICQTYSVAWLAHSKRNSSLFWWANVERSTYGYALCALYILFTLIFCKAASCEHFSKRCEEIDVACSQRSSLTWPFIFCSSQAHLLFSLFQLCKIYCELLNGMLVVLLKYSIYYILVSLVPTRLSLGIIADHPARVLSFFIVSFGGLVFRSSIETPIVVLAACIYYLSSSLHDLLLFFTSPRAS